MFDIHDIVELSGMTRGQIDQLISRHSLDPNAPVQHSRRWPPHAAFMLGVAGELHRLGVSWSHIAQAVAEMGQVRFKGN